MSLLSPFVVVVDCLLLLLMLLYIPSRRRYCPVKVVVFLGNPLSYFPVKKSLHNFISIRAGINRVLGSEQTGPGEKSHEAVQKIIGTLELETL